jgi:glycine/D-amino acid oxidase-like deaminating enzyme
MLDTIVVGAGLFGQVIAKSLQLKGHSILVLDDRREGSGSKPAACLMKPSWVSGLGKEVYNPALQQLNDLYGVHDIDFKVGIGYTTVHWVNPAAILHGVPVTQATVGAVGDGWVSTHRGETLHARHVIVAGGVWTSGLVPYYVEGRAGAAFLWPKGKIERPFISPWAPYRQLVAFNRGDGLWVGDGTAVKTWDEERERVSLKRCSDAVDRALIDKPITLYGQRPYIQGVKHAHIKQITNRTWAASGGAKNGTIGAGYCGHYFAELLS